MIDSAQNSGNFAQFLVARLDKFKDTYQRINRRFIMIKLRVTNSMQWGTASDACKYHQEFFMLLIIWFYHRNFEIESINDSNDFILLTHKIKNDEYYFWT